MTLNRWLILIATSAFFLGCGDSNDDNSSDQENKETTTDETDEVPNTDDSEKVDESTDAPNTDEDTLTDDGDPTDKDKPTDEEVSDPSVGDLDPPVSQEIDASKGGTVAVESGVASLDIPANALSEDLTITVTPISREEAPDAENLGSDVFEFGPDGTQFETPVTLTLALDSTAPDGQTPVIAYLEDDQWIPLTSTSASGDRVTADVAHFSKYAVIFVDDELMLVSLSESCDALSIDEVKTCSGGNIVGSWRILDYCTEMSLGENPFGDTPECNSTVYTWDIEYNGTLDFADDGTYIVTMENITGANHIEVTNACLAGIYTEEMVEEGCINIDDTCALSSGVCTCDIPLDMGGDSGEALDVSTGTYTTSSNTIVMENDDEPDTDPDPTTYFCVSGDRLTIAAEADDVVQGFILEKL